MSKYILPFFGEIDIENIEEYANVEIPYNGRQLEIDLNFEDNTTTSKKLDSIKYFIENLATLDARNKAYLEEDYNDEEGDTVKEYLQHHIEDAENNSTEIDYLKKLHLVRVGFYPDDDSQFAIFDYSIGRDETNYLIVLYTDEKGNINYITMES